MRFQRHPHNPVIPRTPGSFYSKYAANPDLLFFHGKYHLYFRGQAEAGHDQIGVAIARPEAFDGVHWEMVPHNPILPVSADPAAFDAGHILDPAAVVLDGRVYLYYSAHRKDWHNWNVPSHVGLAVSDDGLHFEKHPGNPIIAGTAPEVVLHQGRVHLFFQRRAAAGNFEIYCCASADGVHFAAGSEQVVLRPAQQAGAFDAFSLSTVRIWQAEGWFYLAYGGCDRFFDYPVAIGLARSRDLWQWERYPGNPILRRGAPGSWDEGALWFATVHRVNQTCYLWYEGTGTGLGLESTAAQEASRVCREHDYGGYGQTSFSQIGLAIATESMPEW